MYILSSLRRLLEAAMQDDQDTHEATKAQHPRWKFNFTNPGDSIGITPDAPVWLLVLVELVFFKGRALVHGIDFFLRIWQPHAQEEDCRAWAFKLITANGFERSLRNAGLPVTSWPTPGDAPIAGPCQADRGLTDGRHGMDAVVYGADEPIIRRYDYPDGVYWEVGAPKRRAYPIPPWHQLVPNVHVHVPNSPQHVPNMPQHVSNEPQYVPNVHQHAPNVDHFFA